jgi:hypothetical protein
VGVTWIDDVCVCVCIDVACVFADQESKMCSKSANIQLEQL